MSVVGTLGLPVYGRRVYGPAPRLHLHLGMLIAMASLATRNSKEKPSQLAISCPHPSRNTSHGNSPVPSPQGIEPTKWDLSDGESRCWLVAMLSSLEQAFGGPFDAKKKVPTGDSGVKGGKDVVIVVD